MSENLQLKKYAKQYVEGEIEQGEYIRKTLEEIAYAHSTSFWCKVIELREKHNYATDQL